MERLLQESGFMGKINELSEIYNVDERNEEDTIQHGSRVICLSHYREIVTNGGIKQEVGFNIGQVLKLKEEKATLNPIQSNIQRTTTDVFCTRVLKKEEEKG
ncbi:hypothetical protein ACF0H5_004838 [Mactra antiquata]